MRFGESGDFQGGFEPDAGTFSPFNNCRKVSSARSVGRLAGGGDDSVVKDRVGSPQGGKRGEPKGSK